MLNKSQGYFEKHHIIPKCSPFNGSNSNANLGLLTPKEHYICHLLLIRMCERGSIHRQKMLFAYNSFRMHTKKHGTRYFNSSMYDYIRKEHAESLKGDNKDLREAEQRWLNMIKDEQLYWTPNIYNKTVRYYNQKKHSSGGNGSSNKGKSHPAWNRGQKGVKPHTEQTKKLMSDLKKEYWKNNPNVRPYRIFDCPVCKTRIETRNPNKKLCGNACRYKARYGGAVYLTEYSTKTPNDV